MSEYRLHVKPFEALTPYELYAILRLRVDVFVVEQRCIYPELDGLDEGAVHVWLEKNGEVMAYLRVMDRGTESDEVSIGRVVSKNRGLGLGMRVLRAGIRAAKERFQAENVYLEAQTYAVPFYEKAGFEVHSEPFDMDGIEHVRMLLRLP